MKIEMPLCDPCGERAEMMLSVAMLTGDPLPLAAVANELCTLCSTMLNQIVALQ